MCRLGVLGQKKSPPESTHGKASFSGQIQNGRHFVGPNTQFDVTLEPTSIETCLIGPFWLNSGCQVVWWYFQDHTRSRSRDTAKAIANFGRNQPKSNRKHDNSNISGNIQSRIIIFVSNPMLSWPRLNINYFLGTTDTSMCLNWTKNRNGGFHLIAILSTQSLDWM